jgi:hypothetical protein
MLRMILVVAMLAAFLPALAGCANTTANATPTVPKKR